MAHEPTAEQDAILRAFKTGKKLVIEAGAGTGKTGTLKMIAEAHPNKRGLYVAFGRKMKEEAAASFPGSITCMTSHGLGYQPVGVRYKARLDGKRVPARTTARVLRINEPFKLGDTILQPTSIARLATETVQRFCYSADLEVNRWHVPRINGVDDRAARDALAQFVLPYARKAWAELQGTSGELYFTPDVFLKMYQLTNPTLRYDYLVVDEAQDLNPVTEAIVKAQTGVQVAMVGDRNQAIFGWRGAVDAMEHAEGERYYLSQSFRFGPAIAEEANKWLDVLDADMRLKGYDQVPSVVAPLQTADAVLCRTNGMALSRVMRALDDGIKVGLVGGGKEMASLARAASDLMAGKGTDHPELMAFQSWSEVEDYAKNDAAGGDLRVLVSMVEKYTAEVLVSAMNRLTHERYAKMLISTAHKAKGLEYDRVQIAGDFREPKADEKNPNPQIERADAMLAYVAVTRAKKILDRFGLAWIDNWVSSSALAATVYVPAPVVAGEPADAVLDMFEAAEKVLVLEPDSPEYVAAVTATAPEYLAPLESVLSFTADPCASCGYLLDLDGGCTDCPAAAPAAAAVAEPVAAQFAAPFTVGDKVRYVGKPHATVFQVAEIWHVGGGEWSCHLEDHYKRMQRAVRAEWLEVASRPDAAPALFDAPAPATVEAPAPVEAAVVAEHCRRCGSARCQCSAVEKRRWLALTTAKAAEHVYAALTEYTNAVAGRAA